MSGAPASKSPITAKHSGQLRAHSSAKSFRTPMIAGGTMTTRSTPASSISGSIRSGPNGSGKLGVRSGRHGRSGRFPSQRCTCMSMITGRCYMAAAARCGGRTRRTTTIPSSAAAAIVSSTPV